MKIEELLKETRMYRVMVTDGETRRSFWVKINSPEKAIQKAKKKYASMYGFGKKVGGRFVDERDVTAEIVDTKDL